MLASVYDRRYKLLREQLIGLRKAAKLTQVALGERLGVGQSYVSKVERGEVYVELWLFVDWCAACGVQAPGALKKLMQVAAPA